MPTEPHEPTTIDEHLVALQADISTASKSGDRTLAAKLAMRYADAVLNRGASTTSASDAVTDDA